MDKTVIETVAEAAEDWRLDDIKGLLGRCNFKADMLDRKVSFLSGGEKVKMSAVVLDIFLIPIFFSLLARLSWF